MSDASIPEATMSDPATPRPDSAKSQPMGFLDRQLPTVRAWVGNFGWPILLKQLRTEFRKNRYFYSHFACLAVLGAALLLTITTQASDLNATPTQVGQQVFNWFFWIQFFVVLFIFPVFSATAFTEERSNLSLDLLLITTLSSEEIVWGKFLASGIYCLLYVLATLPLLAISFLFGGVTTSDVLIAYTTLIGVTLLVSMFSLCVSSWYRANIRSLLTVYSTILFIAILFYNMFYQPVDQALAENANQTVITAASELFMLSGATSWLTWLIMAGDIIAFFLLLFLVTANRIRPPADDHSSKMRILAFVYLPIRMVAGFYEIYGQEVVDAWTSGVSSVSRDAILPGMESLIQFAGIYLLLGMIVFATEEADVSTRCRREFRRLSGGKYLLRFFAPGAFWGLGFTVVWSTLVCGILYVLFAAHLSDAADAEVTQVVTQSLMSIPFYLAGFGALGFLLSVSAFTPLYSRLTVTFILIITALLPMIFYISEAEDQIYNFYYLSPLVLADSLQYILQPPESSQVQYRLFDIHIIHIAKFVFTGLFIVLGLAAVGLAKKGRLPLLRFVPRGADTK